MQFLYPTFLWALLALAIPVIIHLFYFRRFKKVYFTNVRFLKEVKEETSARQKLRNLLVLAMRLLALAALIFAFAQPFIPQDVAVKKGTKNVSLFIDNSFSMSAESEDIRLVEKAKQRARQIVKAYAVEDRFQILTNDFEGRQQRLVSQEDAITMIDEITVSPAVRKLSQVLSRQQQVLNSSETENQIAYLISDFQKNITDLNTYQDTSLEINLVPLQSVQERNVAIDSCWFEAPVQMINQTNNLIVKIRNYSDQAAENVRLSFKLDGQNKPVGTMSIPALSTATDTVPITILRTGWHQAELSITDYPVQFDDKYYFAFNVDEEIRVLVINQDQSNRYLDASFSGISYFNINNQPVSSLDYSSFSNHDLIVTNGLANISSGLAFELNQYIRNGGNLLMFPPYNADIGSYKNFLNNIKANELQTFQPGERSVASINTEEFVFKDVFENRSASLKLPVTQGNYKISSFTGRGEERLLSYRDGSPFLSKYQRDRGNFYLCAAPLEEDYNNLVRSGEVFIPMLYKMAISTGEQRRISYTIGKDEVIEAENKIIGDELVYKLKGSQEEFIPQQRIVGPSVILGLNNQIEEAGFYQLFLEKSNPLAYYAFNYDRQESQLNYLSTDDLAAQAGPKTKIIQAASTADLTPIIGERSRGIPLWRWCIILALVFLGLEGLFIRLWPA